MAVLILSDNYDSLVWWTLLISCQEQKGRAGIPTFDADRLYVSIARPVNSSNTAPTCPTRASAVPRSETKCNSVSS